MAGTEQSFRQIIGLLSDQFGNLNLGTDQDARSLDEMLPLDGVHRQVVHQMLQNIYHLNKCTSLDSSITIESTFDALGELAWELKSANHAEVDAITLLEQIGEFLTEIWLPGAHGNKSSETHSTPFNDPSSSIDPKKKTKPSSPAKFRRPN